MTDDNTTDEIKMTVSELAEAAGVPFPEDEREMEEWADEFCLLQGEATGEPLDGEEVERCKSGYKGALKSALLDASRPSFEALGLDLREGEGVYQVSVSPKRSSGWEEAGEKITEVVDGYMGIYPSPDGSKADTLKEICEARDDRDLVRQHLHWVKNYSELYGARFSSPSKRFDESISRKLRNAL
jgi:hypothetical protein